MYVVYDLETSGFSPIPTMSPYHRIVQIAAQSLEGECFSSFVHIGGEVSSMSTAIHHISTEDIKDAPSLGEVMELLFKTFQCNDLTLVAHNNNYFDKLVLLKEMKRHNITFPCNVTFFDTLPVFRRFFPGLKCGYSLSALYKHFYGESFNAHRADADVVALNRMFKEFILPRIDEWYSYTNSTHHKILKECLTSLYFVGEYRAFLLTDKLNVSNVSQLKEYWKVNVVLEPHSLDMFLFNEINVKQVAQRMMIIAQILDVDPWEDDIMKKFLYRHASLEDCLNEVDYYVKYRYFLQSTPPNKHIYNRGLYAIKNNVN